MKRSRLLLLLLLLLATAVLYALLTMPRQQRVARVENASQVNRSGPAVKGDSVRQDSSEAYLDFPAEKKRAFHEPKRDLFRPLYRKPVVVEKPVVAEEPKIPEPKQDVVEFVPPPPVATRPLPQGPKPIPPLNVLGSLEKEGKQTVFLSSMQGDIYLVKRGDRFADGLLVKELSADRIVISRGPADAGVTLNIGKPGQQRMPGHSLPADRPAVPDFPPPEQPASQPVKSQAEQPGTQSGGMPKFPRQFPAIEFPSN